MNRTQPVPPRRNTDQAPIRVLSVTGGGTTGLIPGSIVVALEDATNRPPADFVDQPSGDDQWTFRVTVPATAASRINDISDENPESVAAAAHQYLQPRQDIVHNRHGPERYGDRSPRLLAVSDPRPPDTDATDE